MGKVSWNIKYHLLGLLSLIIGFIGFVGFKLVSVLVFVAVFSFLQTYIGDWGWFPALLFGLLAGGAFYGLFQLLLPYWEKMDSKRMMFKKRPYTEQYGKDYPKPVPKDYSISDEEFKGYNKRFQFEIIELLATYGVFIATNVYLLAKGTRGLMYLIVFIASILFAILMKFLFGYWNERLSQKHPAYKKIKAYQNSYSIYRRIRDENKK